MSTPPFVAIVLKKTRHVLGVLSRDADSAGGSDLALVAPESLTVRAPQESEPAVAPTDPPSQLQVPSAQLAAVVVTDATPAERRPVFSNPLACVVADDGSAAPLPASAVTPGLQLNKTGSVVATFTLDITNNAGADGVPYTVIIQEAKPPVGQPPFRRITEGKVAAGQSKATNVQITLVPGDNPPASPIDAGKPVSILVAAAGLALLLKADPNPP